MRLDGTNFSKKSCNRACATENETWSLDLMLAIVLALCSLSALIAFCGGY